MTRALSDKQPGTEPLLGGVVKPNPVHPLQARDEGELDPAEIVAEWLGMVGETPLEPGMILYPPICQSEINAIRAILEAPRHNKAEGGEDA